MTLDKTFSDFHYAFILNDLRRMGKSRLLSRVSYSNLLYLDLIDMIPDCTASKLSEALHVTKPAVTIRVNELMRLGLVKKETNPADGRMQYIRLNNEAVEEYRTFDSMQRHAVEAVRAAHSPEELAAFETVMQTFSKAYLARYRE